MSASILTLYKLLFHCEGGIPTEVTVFEFVQEEAFCCSEGGEERSTLH